MSIPIPIIFGETAVRHTKEKGIFFCPECETTQSYKKKELWKYMHLYFIPLCPSEKLVTYVKCKSCKSRYEPAVLQATKEATELILCLQTITQKAMLRAMIRVMMADGRIDKEEITMIRNIYSQVSEKNITKAFIMEEVEKMQAEKDSDIMSDLEPVKEILGDEGKSMIIKAMMLVSVADNEVDPHEEKVMKQAVELLFGGSHQNPETEEMADAIASKQQQEKATAKDEAPPSKVSIDPIGKHTGSSLPVTTDDKAEENEELEA